MIELPMVSRRSSSHNPSTQQALSGKERAAGGRSYGDEPRALSLEQKEAKRVADAKALEEKRAKDRAYIAAKRQENYLLGNKRLTAQQLNLLWRHLENLGSIRSDIEEKYIDTTLPEHDQLVGIWRRLLTLKEEASVNPDTPLSEALGRVFPELDLAAPEPTITRPPLPEAAPALWSKDRQQGESPSSFIRRHYQPWLGQGLTQADIRRFDPQLYRALYNWRRFHADDDMLDLPTLKEWNDRMIEQVVGGRTTVADPSHLLRLGQAARRRQGGTQR